MAQSASLALLQGMKKDPPPTTNTKAPPPEAEDGEAVTVEVEKMDSKALDKLVEEYSIEVPADWKKMVVAKKRAWLKDKFEKPVEETEADEEQVTNGVDPEPPPEPKAEAEQEVQAPAAGGKPKKPTSTALAKSMSGEIIPPNELTDVVFVIENLDEKNARALVPRLADSAELTYFKLGGVLARIQAQGWYDPHDTFKEYLENECGMAYRRAMYYIEIYKCLSEANISWDKVKTIGWTKMVELASILTVENVDNWVSLAEKQTVLQLQSSVKAAKANPDASPGAVAAGEVSIPEITTRTFKVHPDQKKTIDAALVKAKEASGTTFDTVALEHICLDFLGTPVAVKGMTLAERMVEEGVEAAVEALNDAFPDTQFSVEIPAAAE